MKVGRSSIHAGLDAYFDDVSRTPLLTAEEERSLAERVAAGDAEARELLVRSNLRLVIEIARHFANRGLAMEDLIAEGNLGLIRAVDLYDLSQGTRLSTYATYWIRQAISRGILNHRSAIRVPCNVQAMAGKVARGKVSEDSLDDSARERIRLARRATAPSAGPKALEFLAAPERRDGDPADVEMASVALGAMDEKGRRVVAGRFGIGREPASMEEVAEEMGVSREWARKIYIAAVRGACDAFGVPSPESSRVDGRRVKADRDAAAPARYRVRYRYRGVSQLDDGRFEAHVHVPGRSKVRCGIHARLSDARDAADESALRLMGVHNYSRRIGVAGSAA